MKINELFDLNPELTGSALAKQLGYTGAEAVNSRRRKDADVPEEWFPRLVEMGLQVPSTAFQVAADEPQVYRDGDAAPQAPPDAPQAPQPITVDYSQVAGYIEGAYKMAAQMAIRQQDELLADVIMEHAPAAGQAWAHWIQSEPKVAALLQRMMIGTPMGEVIGVHVGIVFSYTLARATAREIAAAHAAAAASDGAPEPAPEDHLA